MFKENWPLTGLVKLPNPAGGRQLRLIRQGGDCRLQALCIRGLAGPAWCSPRVPGHPQWGAAGGRLASEAGLKEQDVGRHRMGHGCGRLSTGESGRLVSDTAEKHETK